MQVEVDREIYYWYVVHPKLSDENPTYINPATGYATSPPAGVFWRTYFWNHADPGYPYLSESLQDCDFLWAHLTNTAGPSNGAVGLVNNWVNDVMNWNVEPERPIQPVRIYALHQGYCGEHSDITAAAGRTALIPTICTTNFCEDHTWNEFWDRDWIAWEPVNNYVNSPLVYENGWGKILSAVFNWRGDGSVWTVTDRYSEGTCILNVSITDSLGKPADSEKITIMSNALWGGMYYATWGVTNSLGEVSFILGDGGENFYLRVDGPLGPFPYSGGVVGIIFRSQVGQVYDWEYSFYTYTPNLGVAQAPEYPNPLDDYLLEISYNCPYETAYCTYFTNNEIAEKTFPGLTDRFIANEENYTAYTSLTLALGFGIQDNVSSGSISWVLPTDDPWYTVFSSRELSLSRPYFNVVVNVYRNVPTSVEVELTPYSTPIIIPAGGGNFEYDIAVTNHETVPVTFDVWIMAQLPDCTWYQVSLNPVNLNMQGGATLDRHRVQTVPAVAPAGAYSYEARTGVYPDNIWDCDSFPFEKSGSGDGSFESSWTTSGEPLQNYVNAPLDQSPDNFALSNAYPNPFNSQTTITFIVPETGEVKIAVYNLIGEEVAVLGEGVFASGKHEVRWNGRNHHGQTTSSGIYFVRIIMGDRSVERKIYYLR